MTISTYQIHNVLRAYGKQLSQTRRLSGNKKVPEPNRADRINISSEARRKAVIDKVTSDIINKIIHDGPRDDMTREVFEQLEDEYGNKLSVKEEDTEMVFKVIDKEKGEVTKTLSIEDSKLLKDRLEEITKDKVSNHMIA
ncbi:MAG: hypothetical protein JRJ42_08710 [Deltaproteobacteria bacterium]|nr:hypothetical protein [Deltaproteobacteria bacterium]MBW2019788.1 hypothetical protein [Deltaproteobacteria bacterium]MBW2074668.1 hypothetical protein [Deltaproteobacteria bacterium]RLB83486.1 MAG: hypothetical protein DRH17_02405 [Deltaproteobacteria bacterium]